MLKNWLNKRIITALLTIIIAVLTALDLTGAIDIVCQASDLLDLSIEECTTRGVE